MNSSIGVDAMWRRSMGLSGKVVSPGSESAGVLPPARYYFVQLPSGCGPGLPSFRSKGINPGLVPAVGVNPRD